MSDRAKSKSPKEIKIVDISVAYVIHFIQINPLSNLSRTSTFQTVHLYSNKTRFEFNLCV